MSEIPTIRVNSGENSYEITPDNSHLYMHLGSLACYNHVFIELGKEEDGRLNGTYLFSITPVFDEIAEFMAGNGFPMHVNLRSVAQCDVDAFNKMVENQVGDFDTLPEGWDLDGTESS